MATDSEASNPYAAVLADLRAKRDKIDNTIRVLEELSGLALVDSATGGVKFVPTSPPEQAENVAGMFLGMSIVDAAKKLLGLRKRAMTNSEILAELKAGGVVLTGADPLNVVGSVLTRRFNQVGDVVRVARGTWGLKEWYPNRSFKPTTIPPGREAELAVEPPVPPIPQSGGPDPEGEAAHDQWAAQRHF